MMSKNQTKKGKVYGPDRIGIVGFNDHGFVIAVPAEAHQPWLQQRSRCLHEHVKGMTNLTDGLRKGVELSEKTPKGILRRIWLLSDGYPNVETGQLWEVASRAHNSYININTIGFGDSYDEGLLRRIASSTHNGKFVPVKSLRELTNTLVAYGNNGNIQNNYHHRAETTILVIDLSGSMMEPMDGKTKVTVVEEAVLHLLHYKQQCFS